MLQKLAGRLQWEQMPQGIRVAIPGRRDTMACLYGPLAVVILAGIAIRYWELTDAMASDDARSALQPIATAGCTVGLFTIGCWLAWHLTFKTVLTLDPTETRIQRRIIGVEWDTRSFATCEIRDLRYTPPTQIWPLWTDTDPNTSKIRFEVKGKVRRFAAGITEREACALIDRMMGVYKFPTATEPD
jgi:hypothetical protein